MLFPLAKKGVGGIRGVFGGDRRDAMTTPANRAVVAHVLTESQLLEVIHQAEAGYPEEICGIVIGKPGASETYRVRQVENIANRERQRDPVGVERDARTAYRMDDLQVLHLNHEADEAGLEVVTIYHSHPDHEAYFSQMDRERALWLGGPLWPGANYLVISVRAGRAQDGRYFVWDEDCKDFVQVAVKLPRF
jgi:proteasome lid subunit RPN8/RPN11